MQKTAPTRRRRIIGFGAALAAALGSVGGLAAPAQADPIACQRYRAELANLSDSAGATQRALRTEIGRLEAYYRTLNCEGGQFLFIDTRPPQCGAVEQRIRALNAGYGSENGEVIAARRRQLTQAVTLACADVPPEEQLPAVGQTARGGGQVICVKTCDGSYFPMNNLPDGRAGADELCRALCPGAEAVAYSMPQGDEALRYAASIKGNHAYTALPNAFKFRTRFEPSCACRPAGATWAQSLVKAESMLFRHKGDIFVTPMQAERLSRAPAKVRLTLVGRADRTAAGLAADAAGRDPASRTVAAAPAEAGKAPDKTPDRTPDGAAEKTPDRPGEERAPGIRVIAPAMIPLPARADTP